MPKQVIVGVDVRMSQLKAQDGSSGGSSAGETGLLGHSSSSEGLNLFSYAFTIRASYLKPVLRGQGDPLT